MDETYRRQLEQLVAAMSLPNHEGDVAVLSADSRREGVKMFVDGNFDKRLDKLAMQLEFVADAFDDFEALLMEYVRATPLAALDTSLSDGERMLEWLITSKPLTPVQRDYVVCQQTRHAITHLAAAHRERHREFQALRWRAVEEDDEPQLWPASVIRLNPLRKWARFETSALLEEEEAGLELPCDVLLFADGGEVASAALELEGQVLLNDLADNEPCSLTAWAELSGISDIEAVREMASDLVELGLAAIVE
jgi:hypothetical protein